MRKFLYSLLWVLPFFSFLAGYQFLRYLTHAEVVTVPPVVGLHMHDAIKTLSADRLNVRILSEHEDPDAAEGIILSQTPYAGKVVKPHQSIFLVITRKPEKPKAPLLYGLNEAEAEARCKAAGISLVKHSLESLKPENAVIAQSRSEGEELVDKALDAYISAGVTPIRIMPVLKGHTVDEVISFFKPFDIKVEVKHPGFEHVCSNCIVKDQRPLAGALVNIKKGFLVHITAKA